MNRTRLVAPRSHVGNIQKDRSRKILHAPYFLSILSFSRRVILWKRKKSICRWPTIIQWLMRRTISFQCTGFSINSEQLSILLRVQFEMNDLFNRDALDVPMCALRSRLREHYLSEHRFKYRLIMQTVRFSDSERFHDIRCNFRKNIALRETGEGRNNDTV